MTNNLYLFLSFHPHFSAFLILFFFLCLLLPIRISNNKLNLNQTRQSKNRKLRHLLVTQYCVCVNVLQHTFPSRDSSQLFPLFN